MDKGKDRHWVTIHTAHTLQRQKSPTTTKMNRHSLTAALAACPVEESTPRKTRGRPTCLHIWALQGRVRGTFCHRACCSSAEMAAVTLWAAWQPSTGGGEWKKKQNVSVRGSVWGRAGEGWINSQGAASDGRRTMSATTSVHHHHHHCGFSWSQTIPWTLIHVLFFFLKASHTSALEDFFLFPVRHDASPHLLPKRVDVEPFILPADGSSTPTKPPKALWLMCVLGQTELLPGRSTGKVTLLVLYEPTPGCSHRRKHRSYTMCKSRLVQPMCSLKSLLRAPFCHRMRRGHIMVMCAAPSLWDGGRLLTRGSANRCRNDWVIPVRGDCRSCLCGTGEDCFGKQAVGDTNDSHLGWESAQFQLNQTWSQWLHELSVIRRTIHNNFGGLHVPIWYSLLMHVNRSRSKWSGVLKVTDKVLTVFVNTGIPTCYLQNAILFFNIRKKIVPSSVNQSTWASLWDSQRDFVPCCLGVKFLSKQVS